MSANKALAEIGVKVLETEKILNNPTVEDCFNNEKQLCLFIEDNIRDFCTQCLGGEYVSHDREVYVIPQNKARYDFHITIRKEDGTTGTINLECKSGKKGTELMQGYAQLALYDTMNLQFILCCNKKIRGFRGSLMDNYVVSDVFDYNVDVAASRFFPDTGLIICKQKKRTFDLIKKSND